MQTFWRFRPAAIFLGLVELAIPYNSKADVIDPDHIPYYQRKLNGAAYSILCINTRVAVNPLVVGHTSITEFTLKKATSSQKKLTATSAHSSGYWPFFIQPNVKDKKNRVGSICTMILQTIILASSIRILRIAMLPGIVFR